MNLKTVKSHALAGVMLACSITGALADTAINPETVLEFSISQEGLTRISVANDGIEDIYAYPTTYADNITWHKSGHVFVAGEGLESPFYVTLITRQGIAQDLKLIPDARKAEPILLSFGGTALSYEPSLSGAFVPDGSVPGVPVRDVYARILGQFVQGVVPEGFVPAIVPEVSRSADDVEAILEAAWQGRLAWDGIYRVLVFTVHNQSGNRIALDHPKIHEALWGKGDLASCFDQPALNPQGSAKLWVIQSITEKEAS